MHPNVIARGEHVVLRGWLASDCDHFVRWLAQGEWKRFDAPWQFKPATAEDQERNRQWFLQQLEGDGPPLGGRAVIATPDGTPLGWVSRYGGKDNPHICMVGIDICEDAFLNHGLGTEALGLWVDHLFAAPELHRMGLDTWSFNPRMIRVAEKVGFVFEGRQREVQYWEGEWLDLLHYGLLREEWAGSR